MSDYLVELGRNPYVRQAVKQIGLPLPMPEALRRADGPWDDRPLSGRKAVIFPGRRGKLLDALAGCLGPAGAEPHLVGDATAADPFRAPGEAFGRPPIVHAPGESPDDFRSDFLIFDGSGLSSPSELRALYDAFNPWLSTLNRCGRVIVLGRPPSDLTQAAAAATAAALDGFVRSVAKEIGRKGATAHTVYVGDGAEGRLDALLRFLLSPRAAFLTGQPWTLSAAVPVAPSAPWTRGLDGKTALVTGAARGIGESIAHTLAAEGAHVICLDRPGDEAPCAQVARSVSGTPVALDITAEDAPQALIAELRRFGRRLDVIVHNAGITRDKTLARMSSEHWDQAVAVNLDAVVRLTGALLEGPVHENARWVCLSSVSGLAGNAGQSNYSASKAGVVGYVRALAAPLAARGMTINAVAPGFIETRLTAAMPAMTREVARRLSALGQGGEPRDVAELVTFLSLPGACGLTGQSLRACGGMFIGA